MPRGVSGFESISRYDLLAARHEAPRLHPPFNKDARRGAGFTEEELTLLGR